MNQTRNYARTAQACKTFKVSKSTWWEWVRTRPGFPQPIHAGPRIRLFDLDEVDAFLKSQSKA